MEINKRKNKYKFIYKAIFITTTILLYIKLIIIHPNLLLGENNYTEIKNSESEMTLYYLSGIIICMMISFGLLMIPDLIIERFLIRKDNIEVDKDLPRILSSKVGGPLVLFVFTLVIIENTLFEKILLWIYHIIACIYLSKFLFNKFFKWKE